MTSYPHEARFTALGLPALIVSTRPEDLLPAVDEVMATISSLDAVVSRGDRASEVSRLNRLAAAADLVAPASEALLGQLGAALWAADLTDGRVRPTAPGTDPLAWRGIQVDAATVRLPRGTVLDLSATLPAHAVDLLARSLHLETGGGFRVELAGSVAVSGEPPTGGWQLPVASPGFHTQQVVAIRDAAVAQVGPNIWSRISVAARTALEAKAWALAASTMGELAPAWLTNRGVPARLDRRTGTVRFTQGWPAPQLTAA